MNRSAPTRRVRKSVAAEYGTMSLEKIGVSRFDWRDPYHLAVTLGWPSFLALLAALYVTLNLLFGLLYAAAPGCVANLPPGSLTEAFFFSVQTLSTVGYGFMVPQTLYGHVVSTVETFVGLLFVAMMTGLVFVRFSKPKAKIMFADNAVVTRGDDGGRQLMLRLGNGRPHPLTDVTARITTLVARRSASGQLFRHAVDLKLQRSEMPFFPLMWTLMHPLDEHSPLTEALARADGKQPDLRLLVSVTARDPALDATVSVLKAYDANHVLMDMHYADAVTWDGEHHSVADMRKISVTEPD
jgi:inward rectifier potassium channel